MTPIRFDHCVAAGAGAVGGLGRARCCWPTDAKVVVNDLSGTVGGVGDDNAAADRVIADMSGVRPLDSAAAAPIGAFGAMRP